MKGLEKMITQEWLKEQNACGEVNKDKWIWMPHAGHLIVGNQCRFHLNTYVGKYIVSTVGEWCPDRTVKEIHAKIHDPKWFEKHHLASGEYFDHLYHKRFGFMEIGYEYTYETMVFRAEKVDSDKCCPYRMSNPEELEARGYNNPESAYQGHLDMCTKWSTK